MTRFSPEIISFLRTAERQKNPHWLEKERENYERLALTPLRQLAQTLKAKLGHVAHGYHFPQKGIGRLKRPSNKVAEYGNLFKGHLAYTATRPSGSRFERNPSLFFLINPEYEPDAFLLAGGLYAPSSKQTRAIRSAIAEESSSFAKELDRLFESKDFSARFPGGFCDEKLSARVPRGFDPEHPRKDWLRLQGFFVWRSYSRTHYSSPKFFDLVAADCKQLLRLNHLLDSAIHGKKTRSSPSKIEKNLESLIESAYALRLQMDF